MEFGRIFRIYSPNLIVSKPPRDSPAPWASGWVSGRCTCDKVVRFPDEHREELCEAKSQEGAREPRRGRKGPSEEEVVEVGFDETVADLLPEVAF